MSDQRTEPGAPTVTGTRLGVIVGSGLGPDDVAGALGEPTTRTQIDTPYGTVKATKAGAVVLVHRHTCAGDGYRPPHRLDHHRTIAALGAAGCDRVLALASVGALRDWPVGTFLAPFDFYAPQVNPTFTDGADGHRVPGFDATWRDRVLDTWDAHATVPVLDGGVYAQTTGPRFETAAEVRALARDADVVGMTVAAECILAGEAGLAYAAVCVVDNVGNGLADRPLDPADLRAGMAANRRALVDALAAVLPHLAA